MKQRKLKRLDTDWLTRASEETLNDHRVELDEEIRQIRRYKLQIQAELDRRSQSAQLITPAPVESEAVVHEPKRPWWRR